MLKITGWNIIKNKRNIFLLFFIVFLFASSQNINTKSLITFDLQMCFERGKKHIEELKILYKLEQKPYFSKFNPTLHLKYVHASTELLSILLCLFLFLKSQNYRDGKKNWFPEKQNLSLSNFPRQICLNVQDKKFPSKFPNFAPKFPGNEFPNSIYLFPLWIHWLQ